MRVEDVRARRPAIIERRRLSNYMFAVIQSGLTCLVASAIASVSLLGTGHFVGHWLRSWLVAWGTMLPIVILAAPVIQKIVDRLVRR